MPKIIHLASKMAVIEQLKALYKNDPGQDEDVLQREWKALAEFLSSLFKGAEGWDYSLTEWPMDIPLFNASTNSVTAAITLPVEEICRYLQGLSLPWAVRIESYDRIRDGIMLGGDEWRDLVLTQEVIYLWEPQPGMLSKL